MARPKVASLLSLTMPECFSEWASLNHRENSTEVLESGSGNEVAMDMGNPWDSKPLAASTTVPFDNPFDSSPGPKSANSPASEGWANFNSDSGKDGDSEMSPVKSNSGDFGDFVKADSNEDLTEKSPQTSPQKSPTEETVK